MLDRTATPVTRDAEWFEYSRAANPIRPGLTPRLPFMSWGPETWAEGPSRVIPLDLSDQLRCPGPATSPGLCAAFVRIDAGDTLCPDIAATSQVFYVIRGSGRTVPQAGHLPSIDWQRGDIVALPGGTDYDHAAADDATLYLVHDAPLLAYLGARPDRARFEPTLYPAERTMDELRAVAASPEARSRSRVSVLLGNAHFPGTRTMTQVIWTMFGLLPAQSVQKPHRHQSVALDYIVSCPDGCYTLIGETLDAQGRIVHPVRQDWQSGMAFVTPPGLWHAHYNESDQEAFLMPIQDAGLQTYLRALDIRFG
jgi:gentisate 1,2-dioxygenase